MSYRIVWFKRDLRLHDHAPLVEAARAGPVLCLYVVEPGLWAQPDASARQWGFVRESLRDLRRALAERGARLQVVVGDVVAVLDRLHAQRPFEALHAHEETGNGWTYDRDRAVARWCRAHGVAWREWPQNGVVRGLRERDGWQSHGVAQRRFEFQWQEQPRSARLMYLHDGALSLSLEADTGHADAVGNSPQAGVLSFSADGAGLWVQWGDAPRVFSQLDWQGETAHLFTPQGATRITVLDPLAHAGEAAQEGGRLTAPMPGKVVSFAVKVGDTVKAGQALAVMEAMKMEHTIHAPKEGVVAELLYAPGDQVADGAELLKLAV